MKRELNVRSTQNTKIRISNCSADQKLMSSFINETKFEKKRQRSARFELGLSGYDVQALPPVPQPELYYYVDEGKSINTILGS